MGRLDTIGQTSRDIDVCPADPSVEWLRAWSLKGLRSRQTMAHASSGFDLANRRRSEQEIEIIRKELDDFKRQYEPLLRDLKAKHDKFEQNRTRIQKRMAGAKSGKRTPGKRSRIQSPFANHAEYLAIAEEFE